MRNILETGIGPDNETERLRNLKRYRLLRTNSAPIFDQIAALTATLLKVPIAVINYVQDSEICHFGLNQNEEKEYKESSNKWSIALLKSAQEMLYKIEDPYLLNNPLIAGDYGFRFYAATPIVTPDKVTIGTISILDDKPMIFDNEKQEVLEEISSLVKIEIEKKEPILTLF